MTRTLARLIVLSLLAVAGCDDDTPAIDAAPVPDGPPPVGTISLSWTLESAGDPVECADVGAQFVTIDIIEQSTGNGVPETLNCAAGEATTREVGVGTYDLRFDLLDSAAQSLLAEQIRQTGVEVSGANDTAIGEVVFQVQ